MMRRTLLSAISAIDLTPAVRPQSPSYPLEPVAPMYREQGVMIQHQVAPDQNGFEAEMNKLQYSMEERVFRELQEMVHRAFFFGSCF